MSPAKKNQMIKRKQDIETSPPNMFQAVAKTELFFLSVLMNIGTKT